MFRVGKAAGIEEFDVTCDVAKPDVRKLDVCGAVEWMLLRAKELKDEAVLDGKAEPTDKSLESRMASEFLELPTEQWPPTRAHVFWHLIQKAYVELGKADGA